MEAMYEFGVAAYSYRARRHRSVTMPRANAKAVGAEARATTHCRGIFGRWVGLPMRRE